MDRLFVEMVRDKALKIAPDKALEIDKDGVIETTNIKPIYNLYKILLNINDSFSENRTMGVYETLYALKNACIKYLEANPDTKFKNLIQKNEFINELYTFYEEITLVYTAIDKKQINTYLNTDISKLYLGIINCYEDILNGSGIVDENILYNELIHKLSEGDPIFNEMLDYNNIILKGFDVVNMRYSVLLGAIAKGYKIKISHELPYNKDILHHFENMYGTKYISANIFNIDISNEKTDEQYDSIINSIFVDYNLDQKLNYENIHFMAGFGSINEVNNVCSHVLSLLNDKKIPSYDICIMYDNSELYHSKVIDTCKKMGINFIERRGEPLWNIPLIVMLASILEIFQKPSGGKKEVNVDRLANILSSPYIRIEYLNYLHIRSIIYSRNALNLYPLMEYKSLKSKLKYKIASYSELEISDIEKYEASGFDEYKNAALNIIIFLEQVYKLVEAKTLAEIGKAYLEIFKYIKIDEWASEYLETETKIVDKVDNSSETQDVFEQQTNSNWLSNISEYKKYLIERDNDALARFIDKINEISFNDDINATVDEGNVLFHFTTILNEMMRKVYIPIYSKEERAVTISTLYDARYHDYEYIFILGMDATFLSRGVSNFFFDDKSREDINAKYSYPLFISTASLNYDSMALMANIVSSSAIKNGHIYLSLPYKDESGSINLPHNFIEEIFYKKTLTEFDFNNLVEHALIYQEHYIPSVDISTNDDDTIMGFFLYGQKDQSITIKDTTLDVQEIIHSIQRRSIQDHSNNVDNSAIYFMKHFLNQALNATDILNILICPQYFLDTKLFVGNELTKDEIGIQSSDIGILYHDIFASLYKAMYNKFDYNMFNSKNRDACYKMIDSSIEEVFANAKMLIGENKNDIKFIKHAIAENTNIFLTKEMARAESQNYLYIPSFFEYPFYNYSIYQNGDINIKINGRVDRIDLHYKDKNDRKVDGIRIIDYKPNTKTIHDTVIDRDNIQLILYLSNILKSKKPPFDFEKNNLSVGYIGYNQLNGKKNSYVSECNKTDKLNDLVLGLNDSIKPIFDKIASGIVDYNPTPDGCKNCRKKDICLKSYELSGETD